MKKKDAGGGRRILIAKDGKIGGQRAVDRNNQLPTI
jgi:hypothetical protein